MTTTYCDGLGLTSGSGNPVLLETYNFNGTLTAGGCLAQLTADADGATVATVGGIYDLDTLDNGSATLSDVVFPGGCDDLGLSAFAPPDGGPGFTTPSGASTIAAAYGVDAGPIAIYGVVTAIDPWAATPTAYNGNVYLQDPASGVPAPHSGALVFFAKANAAVYGVPPVRGDVVEVTNVTWAPYKGQGQFTAGATSVVTLLGTSPLPTAVSLGSVDLGPTATGSSQPYLGMRVVADDGPFTVNGGAASGDCPAGVQDTVP